MLSPNLRGGLFMVFAMAGFTFNDALIKLLSANHTIFQLIFLRGILATILIAGLLRYFLKQQALPHAHKPSIWTRAFCELGATYFFLTGLKFLPIANALAILSALPLVVTMGDALFLKAPVGWRRWTAIVVGFTGVLIIVRPGFSDFNFYSIYIVICVIFAAARDLVTKQAPEDIPSPVFALGTSLVITLAGGLATVTIGSFTNLEMTEIYQLAAAAVFLTIAYYFIISAMRVGEISAVTPFRYTGLIWAFLIGFFVFGDPLEWQTLVGGSIIVATGIFTFYREQKLAKRQATMLRDQSFDQEIHKEL